MTLVTTAQVAARLGLSQPLPAPVEARIADAIEESEDKVLTYLGRTSLAATQETVAGLWPDDGFALTDVRAWPQVVGYFDDRYRVVSSVVADADAGTFDVTFSVGLDVANDPELRPIKTFIKADAAAGLGTDARFAALAGIKRIVSSVSGDGQSVSYEKAATGAEAAGSGASLTSLKRWRRLSISQGHARVLVPWPYADRLR